MFKQLLLPATAFVFKGRILKRNGIAGIVLSISTLYRPAICRTITAPFWLNTIYPDKAFVSNSHILKVVPVIF